MLMCRRSNAVVTSSDSPVSLVSQNHQTKRPSSSSTRLQNIISKSDKAAVFMDFVRVLLFYFFDGVLPGKTRHELFSLKRFSKVPLNPGRHSWPLNGSF